MNSLRDIETGMKVLSHDGYHLGLTHVARSTLAYANQRRDPKLFEQTFYDLLAKCLQENLLELVQLFSQILVIVLGSTYPRPQDNKCSVSKIFDFLNSISCFEDACIKHDNCYIEFKCGSESWLKPYCFDLGCTSCNVDVVKDFKCCMGMGNLGGNQQPFIIPLAGNPLILW